MPFVVESPLATERVARPRAARELDAAGTLQRALLPASRSPVHGCDIATVWRPAGAIGGDCYDVVRLSDTRLALSIADVAGRGMPAALLMAHVLASTRAYVTLTQSPGALAGHVNRTLCRNAALETFVTACYALLDLAAGTIAFSNAGHAPPLLVRADGTALRLATGGPLLGVIPDADYAEEVVALRSGDRLLFYTDGVTEAGAADGTEFGEVRLIDLVVAGRTLPAPGLLDAIVAGLGAFSPAPDDDMAMMAIAVA
jgi:phosphoserine phosphatase RsbU/P